MKGLVLTVGNELMGDDGAGPLLAQRLTQSPLENWEVINGGSVPESYMHLVRARQPAQILVVDTADMGLAPGEIRLLSEDMIAGQFMMTTHDLPLSFLIQALKEMAPEVYFIGIQPNLVAFAYPMSPEVKQAVETVYARLQTNQTVKMVAETFEAYTAMVWET